MNTRQIVDRLKLIESLAYIPRVGSTNELARRVADECLENDIALPSAVLIAGEQTAGKGRGARGWYSPARRGIYATAMVTRRTSDCALIPLEIANLVAGFLREVYRVEARIKWPNDILVEGRKIAGILIEARARDTEIFLLIGIGINVLASDRAATPEATSVEEVRREAIDLDSATVAFIEHLDDVLSRSVDPVAILEQWRGLAVHQKGEKIESRVGNETIRGTWEGIDETGRAMIRQGSETVRISAGDLIVVE